METFDSNWKVFNYDFLLNLISDTGSDNDDLESFESAERDEDYSHLRGDFEFLIRSWDDKVTES